jgi:peptidoglycan/LPS O-acetylase OafA/YrhL
MWSLAVEVCFYLVLPLLAAAAFGRRTKRLHGRRFVALLSAMSALAVVWHLWWGPALSEQVSGSPMTWLPSYLTWFAVGMGLAFVHARLDGGHRDRIGAWLQTLGAMPGACWVTVAGLMLVAATPLGGPTLLFVATAGQSLTKHVLYAVIAGLVVLTGVFAVPGSTYARTMSHQVPRHLGRISYSTFCLHLVVLHLVMAWGGYELFRGHGLEIWALTVAGSLLVSELAFRVVETPAQRLRDVSFRSWRRGSQPTVNAKATTTRY